MADRLEHAQRRLTVVKAITSDPKAKVAEVAQELGVKVAYVRMVRNQIATRLGLEADAIIAEYRRLLLQCLPLEVRADVITRVAGLVEDNPRAALEAVEVADKLGGLSRERIEHTGADGAPLIEGLTVQFVGNKPDA